MFNRIKIRQYIGNNKYKDVNIYGYDNEKIEVLLSSSLFLL
jgi:hypothetical protein